MPTHVMGLVDHFLPGTKWWECRSRVWIDSVAPPSTIFILDTGYEGIEFLAGYQIVFRSDRLTRESNADPCCYPLLRNAII